MTEVLWRRSTRARTWRNGKQKWHQLFKHWGEKWVGFYLFCFSSTKKKLILVKNNETETCVKLDPNRILEVEIKINICKIQSKHDKAIFPTHAIQKVNGNVSSVYGMMIFYETFTFKHQVSGNSVSIQSVTYAWMSLIKETQQAAVQWQTLWTFLFFVLRISNKNLES